MPELPEVETIRQSLQKAIIGKKIKDVEVRLPKVFQADKGQIVGKTIEEIERRGKILIIKLSGGLSLLIHFKLTGQLVWIEKSKILPAPACAGRQAGKNQKSKIITVGHPIPFAGTKLPAKTTHVIFEINGGNLFYNDLRQFGWIRVVGDLGKVGELGKLGPEPFDKEFTTDYLKQIFSKTAIKQVLMDQKVIAGIGNIYANEALWEAKIDPRKPAKQLSNEAIEQLRQSIIKVLEEGLKYGGSSAADEAYIKPTGEPGKYQEHFRVYQRDGQKCLKCGTLIKRIDLGGRGTFYCPKCQK